MKTAFSFFLFFLSFNAWTCEINKPLVTLSGPITLLLEELDLLEDKNLKAISNFTPILKSSSAEVLAGGIFLSSKVIKKYEQAYFLIDKSRELLKSFKSFGHEKIAVVDTVGKDSFESYLISKRVLKKYIKGCESKLNQLDKRFSQLEKKINKLTQKTVIFFLGEIKAKLPQMIIGNDGFVLSLKKSGVLKTYASELAYIPWSSKELKKYTDATLIGVATHKKNKLEVKDLGDGKKNIYHRGVLTPGIGQLLFLEEYLRFH